MKTRYATLLVLVMWATTAPALADEQTRDQCVQLVDEAERVRQQGDFTRELKIANQAVSGPCARLPADHPTRALALLALGIAKTGTNDWPGAEAALERAVADYEKILGKHVRTADALDALGVLEAKMGRYTRARELLMRAAEIYEATGDPDAELALTYFNIGEAEEELDNYPEAERMHRKALALRETQLGPNHVDTLESMWSVGFALMGQRKPESATRILEPALERAEKALGSDAPLVGDLLTALARAHWSLNELDTAETLARRALANAEKLRPPNNAKQGIALDILGRIELDRKRYAASEDLFMRALAIYEKNFGLKDPELISVLKRLALVNEKLDRPERAATYKARAHTLQCAPR